MTSNMRSLFDSRLVAIFLSVILMIGCERRPREEVYVKGPNNNLEEARPNKKVRFDVSESTTEKNSSRQNRLQPKKDAELPIKELTQDTINQEDSNQESWELPPIPPMDQLPLPIPPITFPKEATNQLPSLKEIPPYQENTNIFQKVFDTVTADHAQQKDTIPEKIASDLSSNEEEEIPKPWPARAENNPRKVEEIESVPQEVFPTMTQLNMSLGIDVASININNLNVKDIPALQFEFEKIQQAYEAVKQAFNVKDITEDSKSRLSEEAFQLNKPRKAYYECLKAKAKKQKENLLREVEDKLKDKQDKLIQVKQDIEQGGKTTMEELSTKIIGVEKELEQLRSQTPKFSQFAGNLLAFNKAKQESEAKIEQKGTELQGLKKKEISIKQTLNSQILESNNLEREIAALNKEPKQIEQHFNQQIQAFQHIFDGQTTSKKDVVRDMVSSLGIKISQVQAKSKEEEAIRPDLEWEDNTV